MEDDLADVYELDRERVHEAYAKYYNTGEYCRVEFRALREDGELRWIRELMIVLEMKDGKVTLTRLPSLRLCKNRLGVHSLNPAVAGRWR